MGFAPRYNDKGAQPPSGGCELKHQKGFLYPVSIAQPPSGGCELKQGSEGRVLRVIGSRLRAAVS